MTDEQSSNARFGLVRIGIGALQGLFLWLILRHAGSEFVDGARSLAHQSWLGQHPPLFCALLISVGLAPMVLLAGLGQMRSRTLAIWTPVAAAALFALGWWTGWRQVGEPNAPFPFPPSIMMIGVALFIAHHLLAAADEAGRWRAPYDRYFDIAWKHGVQLALSVAFTGAFWLMLMLGATLFRIIGIEAFGRIIAKLWFMWPATSIMFAAAVHLTDVRSGLVRGIRTVALTLLAWLTPLMAAIAAAFLASLPVTGLKPLFDTGDAGQILLGAAGALIILINAAYQDGDLEESKSAVLRWGARGGAVVLVPLVALAAYALALRVGQHGLTPGRVIALACIVVGAAYTLGYAAAALRPGVWMKGLEATNIVVGHLALVVLILLLSPIADPARLSVSDQLARLKRGQITADKFDYRFLRFQSSRFGRDALQAMVKSPAGPQGKAIAERAKATLEMKTLYEQLPPKTSDIAVFPAGRVLPADVLHAGAIAMVDCRGQNRCTAAFVDIDGDGKEEIVLVAERSGQVFAEQAGKWSLSGHIGPICPGDAGAIAGGAFKLQPSTASDIEVNGVRLTYSTQDRICPGDRPAADRRLSDQTTSKPVAPAPRAAPTPRAAAPPTGH